MPGLGDLAGIGSSAEQLFIWNVLGQIVAHLMAPFLQAIDNQVLPVDRNVPLTPAELAGLVVRGHMSESDAGDEAGKSGLSAGRLHQLIQSYGNPPGPQALAEALRRGFIPEGQPGDEAPSYAGGIAQGDLQNKWSQVLKQLDLRLPSPSAVVTAVVRSMLTDADARRLFEQYGGDPSGYDLEVNIAGAGPSPVEAGVLLNRGIIPEHGTGPQAVSFDQAIAESHFKNKWTDSYAELRWYRPPPRTVTAMLHEGRLTPEEATLLLADYGVRPEDLHLYTAPAEHTAVAGAHRITEGEIIKLYSEKGLTEAEARAALVAIGYSEADAVHIIAGADLSYHAHLTQLWTSVLKTEYLRYHLDDNAVVTRLDSLGVQSAYRDSLLQQWQLERRLGVKQLTVKQVLDAFGTNVFNRDQTKSKLLELGYNTLDAEVLVLMNDPTTPPSQATASGLTNPGG